MKRSKRKRLRIGRIIISFLVLILIIFLVYILLFKKDKFVLKKELMLNFIGEDVSSIKEYVNKHKIDLNIDYKYDDNIEKDKIISQSINENEEVNNESKLDIIVSLGKLDKEKLKNDGINELGKVPIMMYHGIKNLRNSDTKYTGGNVDKDGYTRTVEAFREDLEFYYKNNYRMVKLSDYIDGNIDVAYGYSPIVLTFDDGNDNNIKVTGLDDNGDIIID